MRADERGSVSLLAETENGFAAFGSAHLAVIALTVALAVGLPVWARKARSATLTRRIGLVIAAVLVANELAFYVYALATGPAGEFVRRFLPVHLCGVGLFLTAWVLWRPHQIAYELAYFWGLGGTLQAIVTPNLQAGFPDYFFFQFFITHGGIVIGVLFATWAMRLRPSRGSVLRTFVITNVYTVAVAGLDWVLGANYMFLCAPPDGVSPFFFLPWPWYIVFLEGVALALFVLLALPFFLADRLRKGRHGGAPPPVSDNLLGG